MTQLLPSQNRAEYLGRGIYEALVTTLAGLIVAIPAALFAHYFEGRITKIFREIEEIVFALIPKFERYEGRVRFDAIGSELVPRSIDTRSKPVTSTPSTGTGSASTKSISTGAASTGSASTGSADPSFEDRKVSTNTTSKPHASSLVQPLVRKEVTRKDNGSSKS